MMPADQSEMHNEFLEKLLKGIQNLLVGKIHNADTF